jgi:transketolase
VDAISKAIAAAKAVTDKPSIIKVTTTIGYGSPNKADTAGVHGAALGAEEAELTRKQLGWSYGPFEIPQEAYDQFRSAIERGASKEAEWNQTLAAYRSPIPHRSSSIRADAARRTPEGWEKSLPTYTPDDGGLATRKHSQICLGALGPNIPELIGGSPTSPTPTTPTSREKPALTSLNHLRSAICTSVYASTRWPPSSTASLITTVV